MSYTRWWLARPVPGLLLMTAAVELSAVLGSFALWSGASPPPLPGWFLPAAEGLTLLTAVMALILGWDCYRRGARAFKGYAAYAREAQERAVELETVIESMADALYVVSPEGQVTPMNRLARRYLQLPDDGKAQLTIAQLVEAVQLRHPDGSTISPEETAMARALRGECVASFEEISYNQAAGQEVPFRASAAPIRSPDGGVRGAVVIWREITRQKALERQREEFMSMVVHDLKNPLTAALGYAYLLQRSVSRAKQPDPRQVEAVETIVEQLVRMNGMLAELREAARAERDLLELRPRPCELVTLVQRLVAAHQATTDRHELHVEIEPGLERLDGQWDTGRIEQVVDNLLSNAIKYSPEGGAIRVRLQRVGRQAVVTVQDHGLGIPPEHLAHLFNRFYRVPSTEARPPEGLGLGLYIGRQIIERHGGQLWVESTPGEGSAFSFSLPLDEEQARRGAA